MNEGAAVGALGLAGQPGAGRRHASSRATCSRRGHRQAVAHRARLDRDVARPHPLGAQPRRAGHLRGHAAPPAVDSTTVRRATAPTPKSTRRCAPSATCERCSPACATARSTCSRPITHRTRRRKGALLSDAPVGFSGLEIALGAYAAALPDVPLRAVRSNCTVDQPGAHSGRAAAGSLAVGSVGDVTVFAERPWTVDARAFHSKGRNTPFDGRRSRVARSRRSWAGAVVVRTRTRSLPRDEAVRTREAGEEVPDQARRPLSCRRNPLRRRRPRSRDATALGEAVFLHRHDRL